MQQVSPKELHELYERDNALILVDVRSPMEFSAIKVPFARSMPLHAFEPKQLLDAGADKKTPIYVTCKSGARALQACGVLKKAGFKKTILAQGGTDAWVRAGLPVEKGKGAFMFSSAFRLTLMASIVAGMMLGQKVHPLFYALPLLVIAGFTLKGS